MIKSTNPRGPDNQVKRLLKRFPYLEVLEREHENLGSIRVQRKSLKEIQSLLKALPNIKNIKYQFYDCWDDAIQFGYEDYCIFYVETHIDNLPVYSETVVCILKEEFKLMNHKLSKVELETVKITATSLAELLDAQVEDITESSLAKIIARVKENTDVTGVKYLEEAAQTIKEYNYSWDEALGVVDIAWGYNPDTGEWDGSYVQEQNKLPEGKYIFIHGKVKPVFTKHGDAWNACLTSFETVSEEMFYAQKLEDMSGGCGFLVYPSEEAFDVNPVEDHVEAEDLVAFTQDDPEDLETLKEVYFAIKEELLPELLHLQFVSDNSSYLVFCV